jgi:hypothetical protein
LPINGHEIGFHLTTPENSGTAENARMPFQEPQPQTTNEHMKRLLGILGAALLAAAVPSQSYAYNIAVWLDGSLSDGGNAIPSRINAISGDSATLVTTAQLETAGFLSSFDAIVVSRYDSSFGSFLSSAAAANVAAYVGAPGPSQGGVAVFTNDMADNLAGSGSGDPFDPNLDQLFVNAVTYAAQSGHGYIGEFNGAVMAMSSNSAGAPAMGLLAGSASEVGGYGPEFNYAVGPIGSGNPIDAGVTFPFTDTDQSTFLTRISGASSGNIVDIYTDTLPAGEGSINGLPAVLANSYVISGGHPGNGVPDTASSLLMVAMGLGTMVGFGRRLRQRQG